MINLVQGLFAPPKRQLERVHEWNEYFKDWRIDDVALRWAGHNVPRWPEEPLVALVLVPYFDGSTTQEGRTITGVEHTFHQLWNAAARMYQTHRRWNRYTKAGPERLRLLEGIEHAVGLRWEVIDLGCQRRDIPMNVRSARLSPHAGILAAAALHPQWIRAMDGGRVPRVWIPGYEVNESSAGQWTYAPRIRSDLPGYGEIHLSAHWAGSNACLGGDWAVPRFFQR